MRISDRVFGAVVILGALIYGMSALNIQQPFFSDPLGPRSFPVGVAVVAAICGLVMVFSPDVEPDWPEMRSFLAIVLSTALLVGYAYALKPAGFLVPTAIASAVISYQISPNIKRSVIFGLLISFGLFALFRWGLGLSLFALPRWLMG